MKNFIFKILPYSFIIKFKFIKYYFLSFNYLGNKFYCPLCKTNFSKMLDCGELNPILDKLKVVGGGKRKNCLCPRCLSNDRERLELLFLQQRTEMFSKKIKMLHVAPRYSFKKIFKNSNNITYFAGVKYEKDYHYTSDVKELDLINIDFRDNFFDFIICNHVLEHIPSDIEAIRELYRVLKPGGMAIIQVPISLMLEKTFEVETKTAEERKKMFGQYDHYRIYAKDFINRLESSNFIVSLYNPKDSDWNLDVEKYGLNTLESLIIASK